MDTHHIGSLVRARRTELGLTLRALAARSEHFAFTTAHHVELGSTNTTVETLAHLAEALDATWEVRLVPKDRALTPSQRELRERLDALLATLDDSAVAALLAHLSAYSR